MTEEKLDEDPLKGFAWFTEDQCRATVAARSSNQSGLSDTANGEFSIGTGRSHRVSSVRRPSLMIVTPSRLACADADTSELELPPLLQDELATAFAAERAVLTAQIAALSEDAAQSQQAFETYRERAKQSLLKAASEQRLSEGAAAVLREQVQVRNAGCSAAALSSLPVRLIEIVWYCRAAVSQDLTRECAELSEQLVTAQEQLAREVKAWEARLEEAHSEARDLHIQLEVVWQEAAVAAIAEQQRLAHAAEERQLQENVRCYCLRILFERATHNGLPLSFLVLDRSRRLLLPTRSKRRSCARR